LKVTFDPESWSEYLGGQQADAKVLQRINVLIEECRRHPFTGHGQAGAVAAKPSGLVVAQDHGRAPTGVPRSWIG
jgi:toxin YoeB